jgi:hypothetical protein
VLFVGLSPLFLIGRGYLTDSSLNNWDLQIYGILFISAFYLSQIRFTQEVKSNFENSKRYFKSDFAAGLSALFLALIVEFLLRQRSLGDAVAWIGSGDSKNHLVNGAQIAQFGFLNPTTFYIQPVSAPSMLSFQH